MENNPDSSDEAFRHFAAIFEADLLELISEHEAQAEPEEKAPQLAAVYTVLQSYSLTLEQRLSIPHTCKPLLGTSDPITTDPTAPDQSDDPTIPD